jgi:SHOCT-like domain
MSDDRRQILQMLAEGQVTPEEAERLLAALETGSEDGRQSGRGGSTDRGPSYLRVLVDAQDDKEGPVKVNVRVPIKLIRAGVKLSSLIPSGARQHMNEAMREHGVDFDLNQVTPENLDDLVEQLGDLTIDVDSNDAKVRVFCE